MDLKYVLRKINTDRDSFLHGRLLFPRGSLKPQFGHLDASGGSRPLHQIQTFDCVNGAHGFLVRSRLSLRQGGFRGNAG